MRVLHLCSGNLFGGVETMLLAMAKFRSACPELDQSFAYCFAGRLEKELKETGAAVIPLVPVRLSRFWTIRAARSRLREVLRTGRYDVVVCHSTWTATVFGPIVRQAGAISVFWSHDVQKKSGFLPSARGFLNAGARRSRPDLAICNSHFTASSLHHLFSGVLSRVVYLPSELTAPAAASRARLRKELGAAENTVVILQVSRMEACKGHVLHLEALAKIKHITGWQCWIAGGAQKCREEQFLDGLKALADKKGIGGRVRFLGQRSDVPELLSAADLFCQPNTGPESFGIVYVEALAAGLPVIATNMGGGAEIVSSDCGLLSAPDADSLAAALGSLIQNPSRRTDFSRKAPARARELSWPASRIADFYEAVRPLVAGTS